MSLKTIILWNKPLTKAYLERILLDNDYFENGISESEWFPAEEQLYDDFPKARTTITTPTEATKEKRSTCSDMLLYPASKFFTSVR
jgi:hypothetical protein